MALSLFPSTQQADKSDYGDAVDCAAAVGHLSSRVGNSGLASEADLQAIRRAAQIFEARAFRLAGTEQKTRDQTTADLEAAKTEVAAKPTDAARLAIGCVNRLASPS